MTTNALTFPTQNRPANTSEESAQAAAIAEFLMLEQCVQFCTSLAEQLTGRGDDDPFLVQLSDCTAACQRYLAAKFRESVNEDRFATRCVDQLNETAMNCRSLDGEPAKQCRKACEIGIAFIENRSGNTLALRS